jgi:hypothetical protein
MAYNFDFSSSNYGGGGVAVYIHYAMTSATSGDVDWDVAFEKIRET